MSVRGLGVLLCRRGDSLSIYTRDRDHDWTFETLLPRTDPLPAASVTDDGTLILTYRCGAGVACGAAVRAPKASGVGGAWWLATHRSAIGYRPWKNGGALALVIPERKGDGALELEVWLLDRDRAPRLARTVAITGPPQTATTQEGELQLDGVEVDVQ